MVEVQGIWDKDDKKLLSAIAIQGITPKGMSDLKERIQEESIANVIRSGKHYQPSFLEKDDPGRNLGEEQKPIRLDGNEEKEEDRVLAKMKRTQAHYLFGDY